MGCITYYYITEKEHILLKYLQWHRFKITKLKNESCFALYVTDD